MISKGNEFPLYRLFATNPTTLCVWQIFQVNQEYVTLPIIIWSVFCDLYAHAQSLPLLLCKYKTITLKTVGAADTNSTIKCDRWTHGLMDRHITKGKTICLPPLRGWGHKN